MKDSVDVSYFGSKAMKKYKKYKNSKETQLHSKTENEGNEKAKNRALSEMAQEEGVTPNFNLGGDAHVSSCGCDSCMGESSARGSGSAIRGTGFKGIF